MKSKKEIGTKTASQILNLSETHVRYLTKQGRLPAERDDAGRARFKLADIKKVARERARRADR
jgi:excisionase family DNA binding protein